MKRFDFHRELLALLARAARARGVSALDIEDVEATADLFPAAEDRVAITTVAALAAAIEAGPEECLRFATFLDSFLVASITAGRPPGTLSFDLMAEVEVLANRIAGEPCGPDLNAEDTLVASIILQLSVAGRDGWLKPLAQAVAATAMKHLHDPLQPHLFPMECLDARLN